MHPRNANSMRSAAVAAAVATVLAAPLQAAGPAPQGASRPVVAPKRAVADSAREVLKGGEEGTVFRTLTVQGEDKIHIEVERPTLRLDMDPERAPDLDRGSVRDVLDRTTPDLEFPLLAHSSRQTSPWLAHPWLAHFPEGAVARFRPDVSGVERWKLIVVNARAESVAVFQGKGDPPREIGWDGRSTSGSPVLPGASYSYVFEARDKAGNKRNFVGEGFSVSSFRYDTPRGPVLVFSGQGVNRPGGAAYGPDETPPIVMEVATAVNQVPSERPLRIEVTARSREEANLLGQRLVRWMSPYVIGDPARFEPVATVQTDAPYGGAVKVSAAE